VAVFVDPNLRLAPHFKFVLMSGVGVVAGFAEATAGTVRGAARAKRATKLRIEFLIFFMVFTVFLVLRIVLPILYHKARLKPK
jgi:hypothetical protein